VPHAAQDELDELQLEVKADKAAPATAEGSGDAEEKPAPSTEQRQAAAAVVNSMLPRVQQVLEQLLERLRLK
jgi:hypothetical protein